MPVQNIVCVQCIEESAHFFLLRYIGRQHTSTTQNHWELYTAWQWILPAVSTSLPQCIWTATTQPASEKWIHLPLMSCPLQAICWSVHVHLPPMPWLSLCICNNLQQRVSMQFWSILAWFMIIKIMISVKLTCLLTDCLHGPFFIKKSRIHIGWCFPNRPAGKVSSSCVPARSAVEFEFLQEKRQSRQISNTQIQQWPGSWVENFIPNEMLCLSWLACLTTQKAS